MEIIRKISKYNFTANANKPIFIVVHNTGVDGQTAKGNANYFGSANRNASAHYFVDPNEIVQVVEDYNAAWHCGYDSTRFKTLGATNYNSIGIEVCGAGKFTSAEIDNLKWLVQKLMKKYSIPASRVIRHYDCNTIRKHCPAYYIDKTKWNGLHSYITTADDPKMKSCIQATFNATDAQLWRVVEFGDVTQIENDYGVLDVSDGSTVAMKDGRNVWVHVSNATPAQRWLIIPCSNGCVQIVSSLDMGYCLGAVHPKRGERCMIGLVENDQTAKCKWHMFKFSDRYVFLNHYSMLALDSNPTQLKYN